MNGTKAFIKFIASMVACYLILGTAGCSLVNHVDKDKALDAYNGMIQNAGKVTLTKSIFLKGDRKFGADNYIGTYKADYKHFTGTEYLFGGTAIERKNGKHVTITCTFDVTDGTAKLFWHCGSKDPAVLLDGSGKYSDTVELLKGGNYFGITGDDMKGSVKLTIADTRTEENKP